MKMILNKLTTLAIFLGYIDVKADLPISCDKRWGNYIGNTWTFHVNKQVDVVNLYQVQEVCQHTIPNTPRGVDQTKVAVNDQDIWKVEIKDEFNCIAKRCTSSTECNYEQSGCTWDLLFGESVVFELDSGKRFLANLQYSQQSGDSYSSICDKTMLGFVQQINGGGRTESHPVQCFYGVLNEKPPKSKTSVAQISEHSYKKEHHSSHHHKHHVSQKHNSLQQKEDKFLSEPKQQSPPQEYIPQVLYKPEYQSGNNQMSQMSLEQEVLQYKLNNLAQQNKKIEEQSEGLYVDPHGIEFAQLSAPKKFRQFFEYVQLDNELEDDELIQLEEGAKTQQQLKLETALKTLAEMREQYKLASDIPEDEIPSSFDLRNVGGVNFMGRVRDQGACGSCYTVSFVSLIESRLKYQGGLGGENLQDDLSVQHLLSCNYLTEACDGGWAINHGYFLENAGLVKESCAPYEASSGIPCSQFSSCSPVARVRKSYKLRNPSELDIQREILRNGPVITDYTRPSYMAQMSSGSKSLSDGANQPNHASVIIGWGEGNHEEGQGKYWIVRNSRGETFGALGHNHPPRGNNDNGIETDILAFIPEFI